MITCPYCGTHYASFQTNCRNCGAPLPQPEATPLDVRSEELPQPPPAPRPISDRYVWRLLTSDAWSIVGLVFFLLGFVFGGVGAGLTLGIITAFVGIPFLLLGLLFLLLGGGALVWRYQNAEKIVAVLRDGLAVKGEILEVEENYSVTVNGRHPWGIRYRFDANGKTHEGSVTTLSMPDPLLQPGKAAYVLYLAGAPQWNSIYPHP